MMPRKIAFALTMTILISVPLFLPCVKTDVKLKSQIVDLVKNWSFEDRDMPDPYIPNDGVYRCPPWETNKPIGLEGGWRNVRGDVNSDGVCDMKDVFAVILAFGSKPGDPKWNPDCDINGDCVVDTKDQFITIQDFSVIAKRKDGSYSWYTSGGGDYQMWQWLDSDVVVALAGEKVKFSFYYYPESVAGNGSKNNARAEIYYIYDYPDTKDAHVNGSWTAPTELKWWNPCVTAILPPTTYYIAVIIHGKPDFKAWIDLAQLTTPDYNLYYTYPPYENQDTYPPSGYCYDWVNRKVCAYGNKTTGEASVYSLDWSDMGTERVAYVKFNTNPPIGNSPVKYEEDDFTVGAYWNAYGYLGPGGPGIPCMSSVSLVLYVYKWVYRPDYWRWEHVKTYAYTINSYYNPNQHVEILASVSWWMHISPPFGNGSYSVVAEVRTVAVGGIDCWEEGFARADFFYYPYLYYTFIYYIKISD